MFSKLPYLTQPTCMCPPYFRVPCTHLPHVLTSEEAELPAKLLEIDRDRNFGSCRGSSAVPTKSLSPSAIISLFISSLVWGYPEDPSTAGTLSSCLVLPALTGKYIRLPLRGWLLHISHSCTHDSLFFAAAWEPGGQLRRARDFPLDQSHRIRWLLFF